MESRIALIGVAAAGGVLLCAAGSAQTYETGTGGSARLYGQFSPTWLSFDDGRETTDTLADNADSNTRLGFALTRPVGASTLTMTFETALGLVQTSEISNNDIPGWIGWQRTDLRKFEAAYSGVFGTVTFGQGSMATDGIAELDASGTTIAGYSAVSDVAGGFFFRDNNGLLSDVTIGDAFQNLDGSRRFRLRYDTPEFFGISVAAAYGRNLLAEDDQTDYYDFGLRWSGEAGDFALATAAGYAWAAPEEGATAEQYAGSATLLHMPTGLNLAIAGGAESDGGSYGYIKGGWIGDFWAVGETAFSADYYSGRDFGAEDSRSQAVGVSAVQNFAKANLQVYLGWRSYSYEDDAGVSYQDGRSILAGARVCF